MLISDYEMMELSRQKYNELLKVSNKGEFGVSRRLRSVRRAVGHSFIELGRRLLKGDGKYPLSAIAR